MNKQALKEIYYYKYCKNENVELLFLFLLWLLFLLLKLVGEWVC